MEKSVKNKKNTPMLKVTLVKSAIGYNKNQAKIVEALGFKGLNSVRMLPDNPCIRGSLFKVKHLVKVEEVKE